MLAPTPASPESAGMSKAAFDRLEAHLKRRYIDAGRFPGTQLLVYRRGKIVHSAVQGFADIDQARSGLLSTPPHPPLALPSSEC